MKITYYSDLHCLLCETCQPQERVTTNVIIHHQISMLKQNAILDTGRETLRQLIQFLERIDLINTQRAKARAFKLNVMRTRS